MTKAIRRNDSGLLAVLAVTAAVGVAILATTRRSGPRRPPDSAPARTARRSRFGDRVVTGRTVTINAPRSEVFAMWRDPSRLPEFLRGVRSVGLAGDGGWRWRIAGPGGVEAEAETCILDERPDEALVWASTEDSEIDASGKIVVRDAPGGRGAQVEALIAYRPWGGVAGHWIAKAFGKDPKTQGRHELKRLKMLMETGEIATAANRREA